MNALGDEYGRKNGLSRRRFFQTSAGMATAFVAMNEVYGPLYGGSPAEAKSVDLAQARADGLKDQFIMDVHTHFLRDDTRLQGFVARARGGRQGRLESGPRRQAANDRGPQVSELVQGDLSRQRHQGGADQRLALGEPRDWFLTNHMKLDARTKVNTAAGSRRMLSHAIFTPG